MRARELCQELVKHHGRLQEMLREEETITRDDALALANLLAPMCDTALLLCQKGRTCPGRYWRVFEETQRAITAFNETSRKRQKISIETSCCGTARELTFEKSAIGPDCPGGNRFLCDSCASAYQRDKQKGFVPKQKNQI
jgi:hypothetical protein